MEDHKNQKTEKLIQIIPIEIMSEIKNAAKHFKRSLDEEVASRLLATLIKPGVFGLSTNLDAIINKKFNHTDIKLENEARQRGWMYVYQKQKLRLYLELQDKLPKKFKENFLLENLDEEEQRIQIEIETDIEADQQNRFD